MLIYTTSYELLQATPLHYSLIYGMFLLCCLFDIVLIIIRLSFRYYLIVIQLYYLLKLNYYDYAHMQKNRLN